MPIYEYQSVSANSCSLCGSVFEVRQGIDDEFLTECPKCGHPVKRLLSRSFVSIVDKLSLPERLETYSEEEADGGGLEGGFSPDQIWE